MNTVISKDGTQIAFDKTGEGPAVILVNGALVYRAHWGHGQLTGLLADHFTVYTYDRRGRGESGNNLPYAVEREIDDLEAIIDVAGGSAYVYGDSSGAALVLEAAIKLGGKVSKFAMYEAPYNSEGTARQAWIGYRKQLDDVLSTDRRGRRCGALY
jgi:pimeloyl-ACP methyl ester carboxylesterase